MVPYLESICHFPHLSDYRPHGDRDPKTGGAEERKTQTQTAPARSEPPGMGLMSPRSWWRAFGFARGAAPTRRDSVGKGWAAWLRRAVGVVLRSGGPIPKHVAIVMDGNRRFAETRGLRKERGHEFGAEKLLEVLEWSLALGVECLSVYAFSTDNFKRSKTELDVLFELAERRLDEMATSPVIHDRRVRVQVLGELHTLPPGVRRAAANAMAATAAHSCGPVLNVCFAYTGREDACRAVSAMALGVKDGTLDPVDDVTERTMERCMHGAQFDDNPLDVRGFTGSEPTTNGREGEGTADGGGIFALPGETATATGRKPGAPPVDLLIRTSGETRLSDFMLWGISGHAVLCFQEVLWPDFSFTDMCYAAWTYQRSAEHCAGGRARYEAARADAEAERRDRRTRETERAVTRRAVTHRAVTHRGKGSVGSAGRGAKTTASESTGTSVAEVSVDTFEGAISGADRFVAERNRAFVRETLETAATVAVTT